MESDKDNHHRCQYFVSMMPDPEYNRLRLKRLKNNGANELDIYLNKKHDDLLSEILEEGSYKKIVSLVIVDAFAVDLTNDEQANLLRAANGVRHVVKNEDATYK